MFPFRPLAVAATLLIAAPLHAQTAIDAEAFVAQAASSNMFEIQSSEYVLEQGASGNVATFAQAMIADHTMATQNLVAAAATDGVEVPAQMAPAHQQKLEALQTTPAVQRDDAYVTAQVLAHQEAVALISAYAEGGEEGALRDFAAATLPALESHHEMARGLHEGQ